MPSDNHGSIKFLTKSVRSADVCCRARLADERVECVGHERRVVEKNVESAVALGFGTENTSALIKALEKEAGVEVKAGSAR